jgi:hypothetical protein
MTMTNLFVTLIRFQAGPGELWWKNRYWQISLFKTLRLSLISTSSTMYRIITVCVFFQWYTILTIESRNKYMSLAFSSNPTKHPVETVF